MRGGSCDLERLKDRTAMQSKKCRRITSEIELLNSKFSFAGKTVADVGCGVGRISRLMAQEGAMVYGIDIPELITKARELGGEDHVIFKNGKGQELPLDSNSIDIVIFMASFHHIPVAEMPAAIGECHRVLKERGTACFIEPFPQRGSYCELTRLVGDETEIQRRAYENILAIDKEKFEFLDESLYFLERSFDDYRNLIDIYVDDAGQKGGILAAAREIIDRMGWTAESAKLKSFVRMNRLEKSLVIGVRS